MIPRRVQLFALTLFCLEASATAHAEPCRSESFKCASYIVCGFNPTRDDVRMYWRGVDEKPNGVFYIGKAEVGIVETERFLADRPDVKFATQSGPLLVIDGAIHPAFI